jgi:hypothetical protein
MTRERAKLEEKNSVLKTKRIREAEARESEARLGARFPVCQVRLRFPDSRELWLQAGCYEIATEVLSRAVQRALAIPTAFELRTTPPPTPLPAGETFLRCGLVPNALVHVVLPADAPLATELLRADLPRFVPQQQPQQQPQTPAAPPPAAPVQQPPGPADEPEESPAGQPEQPLPAERAAELAAWRAKVSEQGRKAPAWFVAAQKPPRARKEAQLHPGS